MTVADLALNKFHTYIQQGLLDVDGYQHDVSRARCCLFMLLRYIEAKQSGVLSDKFKCCNNNHMIATP